MGNLPSTSLTIRLGNSSANDCTENVLFQVKNGNLLPGQQVHFLIWGLSFDELDKYSIVNSSQQLCTFLGNNTITTGEFSSEVFFEGDNMYTSLDWPCPAIKSALSLTGITGIKHDNTLVSLYGPNQQIPNVIRRGYCCAEYVDSSVKGIVGGMKIIAERPLNKEFSGYVTKGVNPFFVLREGLFVKAFNVEVTESEVDDSPSKWYGVNLYFVDADTGMPLDNVSVTFGDSKSGVCDEEGKIQFTNIKPGTYNLTASKIGYYKNTFDDLDNDEITVGH